MTTDMSEKSLEAAIVKSLVEESDYIAGDSKDYDREHAIDTVQLENFVNNTQPEAYE